MEQINQLVEQAEDAIIRGQRKEAAEAYREAAKQILALSQRTPNSLLAGDYSRKAAEYFDKASSLEAAVQAAVPVKVDIDQGPAFNSSLRSTPSEGYQEIFDDENAEFTKSEIKNGATLVGVAGGCLVGGVLCIPVIGGVIGGFYARSKVESDSKAGRRARKWGVRGARLIRRIKSCSCTKKCSAASRAAYDEWNKPQVAPQDANTKTMQVQ